jgi:AcrR family transcriptional regulator
MDKPVKKPAGSARERIISVASDLFYYQGIRATGINEVIEKSGVAKATFYNHFPSKDDLVLVYLQAMRKNVLEHVEQAIATQPSALKRFLVVIEVVGPWMEDTDYRGCPFINMASEIPDPDSPLRKEAVAIYSEVGNKVQELAAELIASDPEQYGHLDPEELANDYMMVYTGAIALTGIYHANWPVEQALKTVRRLIGEAGG